jgi:glycosyltransferase involved in cell wall biosynthesis
MKKILIDGRFIGVGDSMTRYCLETLRGILRLDTENKYTLLIRPVGEKELDWYPEIKQAPNLMIEKKNIPHYSIGEQVRLLNYLKKNDFDLVHFIQFNHPILYKKPFVATIHDLILINHSKGNPLKRVAFKRVMSSAVKNSKRIITISKATKDEIEKTFKVDTKKIDLIYHGVDHDKFNILVKGKSEEIEAFKKKHGISLDYLLYVGAWKSHKNLLGLIEAYKQYLKKNDKFIHLVLVGGIDKKEPEVMAKIKEINESLYSKFNIQNSIITTGSIDVRSEELPIAYAGAIAYVIPSFVEGFGWPPLEAMACGTPVISANISSMPEILGDGAYYFDPSKIEEITQALGKIIEDHKLREELIKKGLDQVKKYNWDETAKETLNVYKSALK